MKKFVIKNSILILCAVVLILLSTALLHAFSGGITGRSLKSTNTGCSCHGNNPVLEVTVSIGGPDTINTGQTAVYSLTITKLSKTGAGLDIAVRHGTLSPESNNIHVSNGELTHNFNIPMTNGTVTVQFNYTAPTNAAIDTIWATGLASNSDGTSSGDNWNWAPSKRVVVRNPNGIKSISGNIPNQFVMQQNYPNPFNPATNIRFSLPQSAFVNLIVYNITGKQIETLVNEDLKAGSYNVDWNADKFASGIYFYRMQAGIFTETRKMILVK